MLGGSSEVDIGAEGLSAALVHGDGMVCQVAVGKGLWHRQGLKVPRPKSPGSLETWPLKREETALSSLGRGRGAGSPPLKRRAGGRSPAGRVARGSAARPVRAP